jgi:hypothetical protein
MGLSWRWRTGILRGDFRYSSRAKFPDHLAYFVGFGIMAFIFDVS